MIRWEEWESFGNDTQGRGIKLPSPNDYVYLQIRTAENLTGQEIAFNETFYGKRERVPVDDLTLNQCTPLPSNLPNMSRD